MPLTRCSCIGHLEQDCEGSYVWVVDVCDYQCPHPLHETENA